MLTESFTHGKMERCHFVTRWPDRSSYILFIIMMAWLYVTWLWLVNYYNGVMRDSGVLISRMHKTDQVHKELHQVKVCSKVSMVSQVRNLLDSTFASLFSGTERNNSVAWLSMSLSAEIRAPQNQFVVKLVPHEIGTWRLWWDFIISSTAVTEWDSASDSTWLQMDR